MIFSKTVYLTLEIVLDIHEDQLAAFGGRTGVRDLGLLEGAVAAPQAGFGDEELYKGVFEKAAVYAFSIAESQPFVDGNKRTGLNAALLFLALNGHELNECRMELYDMMIHIAKKEADKENIAELLRNAVIDSITHSLK